MTVIYPYPEWLIMLYSNALAPSKFRTQKSLLHVTPYTLSSLWLFFLYYSTSGWVSSKAAERIWGPAEVLCSLLRHDYHQQRDWWNHSATGGSHWYSVYHCSVGACVLGLLVHPIGHSFTLVWPSLILFMKKRTTHIHLSQTHKPLVHVLISSRPSCGTAKAYCCTYLNI